MGNQTEADSNLDCVGLYCPEPVFRTRQALDQLEAGQILEVVADDPASEEDIPRLVKHLEHKLLKMYEENGEFHFLIQKME
ncbi:MAG: sulfurtransferase TusA family protein [Candidatus Bathyarchaeota archaeon]|nr:sulfurtransferase TusA family protein [Candidatus Bathyarchaeum sp.]